MDGFQQALRTRYALQDREKREARRPRLSEEEESILREWHAISQPAARQPAVDEANAVCQARPGGCSWMQAMAILFAAHDAGAPPSVSAKQNVASQWLEPTSTMNTSMPAIDGACARVHASTLTRADMLRLVQTSQPIVIEGLLDRWPALQTWSVEHFLSHAANATVKVYMSPDGEYEGVRRASDPLEPHGQLVCSQCEPDELVLLRPAETEMSFDSFVHLANVSTYPNWELAQFYLQKHSLHKWAAEGLAAEAAPRPHEQLAPWLRMEHELLWLSAGGTCPVAPLHFDEYENLHAIVSGAKRFELYHPAYGKGVLQDGRKMRTLHYLWRWDDEAGRGYMHAINPLTSTPSQQPFSPVQPDRPDAIRRWPALANARKLECDVRAGDTIYIPSFWWHRVEATTRVVDTDETMQQGRRAGTHRNRAQEARFQPDKQRKPRCGLTAGVNYFFSPYYRKVCY
jgi:hypothetical protein